VRRLRPEQRHYSGLLSVLANGHSLDGNLCHLRNERHVPRRLGHFGGIGIIADFHDHDGDPRWSFHGRVALRISLRKIVAELRHRMSNDCYDASRTQLSLGAL